MAKAVRVPHICPPPIQIEPDYNNPDHQQHLLNGDKLWRCIITECGKTMWLQHGVTDFPGVSLRAQFIASTAIYGFDMIEIPEEDYEWRIKEITELEEKRYDEYARKLFSS